MLYAQLRIRPRKWDTQNSLWDTNRSPNLGQTIRLSDCQKQQQQQMGICRIVDFVIPVELKVKLKETQKREKYQDVARELKNYGTWKWQWY